MGIGNCLIGKSNICSHRDIFLKVVLDNFKKSCIFIEPKPSLVHYYP